MEAERAKREKGASATGPPVSASDAAPTAAAQLDIRGTLGGIGTGIGSLFGRGVASIRGAGPVGAGGEEKKGLRPMSLSPSVSGGNLRGGKL